MPALDETPGPGCPPPRRVQLAEALMSAAVELTTGAEAAAPRPDGVPVRSGRLSLGRARHWLPRGGDQPVTVVAGFATACWLGASTEPCPDLGRLTFRGETRLDARGLHLLDRDPDLHGDLAVIDPAGTWMKTWSERFSRLRIQHLRSPGVHHPGCDPHHLSVWSQRNGCGSRLPYDLPSAAAFEGFCAHLVAEADIAEHVVPSRVRDVEPGPPACRLTLADGTTLRQRDPGRGRPARPGARHGVPGRDLRHRPAAGARHPHRGGCPLMWSWLADPYRSEFMRNALGVAVIVGVLCPVVGVWVVLRRLAYLGDAMSHASLSGVALAYLAGASIVVGALAAGLVMGGLVGLLGTRRRLADDTVIGVVETILFALGVLVISRSDRVGVDLTHFLFGQITTADGADLRLNGILAGTALTAVAVLRRDLLAATFDPLHARQVGIPTGALRFAMLALVSISVVVSLQTVGLLMSVAMVVTPAATARLVTHRLATMTLTPVAFGVTAAAGGLTLSYHLASPPGATIALTAAGLFLPPSSPPHRPASAAQGRGAAVPSLSASAPEPSPPPSWCCGAGTAGRKRPASPEPLPATPRARVARPPRGWPAPTAPPVCGVHASDVPVSQGCLGLGLDLGSVVPVPVTRR